MLGSFDYAVILRSAIAHGTLRGIDAAAARARPGVHAVLTAADFGSVPAIPFRPEPLPGMQPFIQPVLAQGKVRYVGEPLALVLADSAALAEDALEFIDIDIDPLPAVADWQAAARPTALLVEAAGSNRTADTTRGSKCSIRLCPTDSA